jgi:LysR family transcriptional regulator, hydrogen peroxide-inducible genes activator
MEVCHLSERPLRGEMADLRASSLETLLQLVRAGFGCTLIPALAIRGGWMSDSGIVTRPLAALPDAYRRISLVFRKSFPRRQALEAFAAIVRDHLPNTVKALPLKSGARDLSSQAADSLAVDRSSARQSPSIIHR